MTINYTMIKTAVKVAGEIFCNQTAEDLQTLREHFGKAYNEVNIIAEIAVKLVLRIGNVPTVNETRELSPVDVMVIEAQKEYAARFGG